MEHYMGGSGLEGIMGLTTSLEEALSKEELEKFRRIPSFRSFVEEDVKGRARYLIDDLEFRTLLNDLLIELENSTSRFNIIVQLLYVLTKDLPRYPLGKHVHTVYLKALSEPIHQSHDYREAFMIMKLWGKQELMNKITQCHSVLLKHQEEKGRNNSDEILNQITKILFDSVEKLKAYDENVEIMKDDENDVSPSKKIKLTNNPKKRMNRSEWQESLKSSAAANNAASKTLNPFESLRNEILDSVHEIIRKYCKSPALYCTFHELKYFDKVGSVRRHLIGDPRAAIQTALTYPGDYLDSLYLQGVGRGEIPSELPDISIAFKLYSECGKLVNLYDWLQCWLSVVKNPSENENDEVDEFSQARFSQCVSELQFMGFIKPSKRKTDHVSRLTWGGC